MGLAKQIVLVGIFDAHRHNVADLDLSRQASGGNVDLTIDAGSVALAASDQLRAGFILSLVVEFVNHDLEHTSNLLEVLFQADP